MRRDEHSSSIGKAWPGWHGDGGLRLSGNRRRNRHYLGGSAAVEYYQEGDLPSDLVGQAPPTSDYFDERFPALKWFVLHRNVQWIEIGDSQKPFAELRKGKNEEQLAKLSSCTATLDEAFEWLNAACWERMPVSMQKKVPKPTPIQVAEPASTKKKKKAMVESESNDADFVIRFSSQHRRASATVRVPAATTFDASFMAMLDLLGEGDIGSHTYHLYKGKGGGVRIKNDTGDRSWAELNCPVGSELNFEYDFGSTTHYKLTVVSRVEKTDEIDVMESDF